ncbi:MAG: hypothetical protein ACRC4G_02220 [Alphaproteobacteria bacterium]
MIKQKKFSIKLAAASFLLSVTAPGYSVLHKFQDESAYDDQKRLLPFKGRRPSKSQPLCGNTKRVWEGDNWRAFSHALQE